MRFFSISSALFVVACFSTSAFAQGAQYVCNVNDMITFGDDAEFVEQNMNKQFFILLDDDRVYVTQVSENFQNGQSIYTIVQRTTVGHVYAVAPNVISMDTIALDAESGDATIVLQFPYFTNVWKLDCDVK